LSLIIGAVLTFGENTHRSLCNLF